MAVTLKIAKMGLGGLSLSLEIVNKQLKNQNKFRPPKHTLALPTGGGKCLNSELQQFEEANFDLGHPLNTQSVNCEKFTMWKSIIKRDHKQEFS